METKSRQVRRREKLTNRIDVASSYYYGARPPYVARSKYLPHVGAKQRRKGVARINGKSAL